MTTATSKTLRPFRISAPATSGAGERLLRRTLRTVATPAVERVLAFPQLNAIYQDIQRRFGPDDPRHFAEKALAALDVTIQVDQEQFESIPRTGPLLVVANHPFGGLEGLILAALLSRVRPDARLLANYMLSMIPDLRETFFFVDPFGAADSTRRNMASMKSALRWVKDGGCLGVFPAGEVSHLHLTSRVVVDPPWSDTIARLAQLAKCPVLPIYFDGRNSGLFQVLGMVHPRLRTVMLPRELLKKRHQPARAIVGNVIPWSRLERFTQPQELTSYLRVRTYILRSRTPGADEARTSRRVSAKDRVARPIIDAVDPDDLQREIDSLPAEQTLHVTGDMRVLYARSLQLPGVLREIGRLREIAFRAVGEGTGQPLDLDRFDQSYLHLVVWNAAQRRVIGSYRLGPTDDIIPAQGLDGLYTSTLFKYQPQLMEQIGPALELGRSFVHPQEQKSYAPLMLLWKGIALFVCRRPHYKTLFGPVSISADYNSVSKQLLVAFLRHNKYLPSLAKLIRPMNPLKERPFSDWDPAATSTAVRDMDEVDELVSEIEADRKSMPVLLRQYLKLNGRLLGFNIDPEFGDVLDGLILVDLTQVAPAVLVRYMGKANAAAFLAHHGKTL
jgi:putative hemolysin